jgi:hypothetical protein
MNTERKIKDDIVFRKQNDHEPIKFGEINIELQPNDVILAGHDEGFYSEDNSWDAHYFLEVHRDRLETDEEYEKRINHEKFMREDMKKRRYETYLRLKKEFENGQ